MCLVHRDALIIEFPSPADNPSDCYQIALSVVDPPTCKLECVIDFIGNDASFTLPAVATTASDENDGWIRVKIDLDTHSGELVVCDDNDRKQVLNQTKIKLRSGQYSEPLFLEPRKNIYCALCEPAYQIKSCKYPLLLCECARSCNVHVKLPPKPLLPTLIIALLRNLRKSRNRLEESQTHNIMLIECLNKPTNLQN